jgi:hypothetical protein
MRAHIAISIKGVSYPILELSKIENPKSISKQAVVGYVARFTHMPPPDMQHQLFASVVFQIKKRFRNEVITYSHDKYETQAIMGTRNTGYDRNSVIVWVTKRKMPEYRNKSSRELRFD